MLYMGVGVALATAAVLVAVLLVPPHVGSTGSSLVGAAVLTYSGARPVADSAASQFQDGGWTLLVAVGLVSAVPESIPVNTTELGNISCVFSPAVTLTNLTVPGYTGNRSWGASPAWEFVYRNAEDTIALVSVIDGQGTVLGTVTGLECAFAALLVTPIPGNVINSSQAAGAVAPEAHAFLATYPNASADFALVGSHSAGGGKLGAEWTVVYSTCPLSSSASGTGPEFKATVDASTGTVLSTNTTSNASCRVGTPTLAVGPSSPPASWSEASTVIARPASSPRRG